MKEQPWITCSPVATSVGSPPIKGLQWQRGIVSPEQKKKSNAMITVLNQVRTPVIHARGSQLLLTPICQDSWAKSNFPLAFNNLMCVNIVFICKRVYFFDNWPLKGNGTMDYL